MRMTASDPPVMVGRATRAVQDHMGHGNALKLRPITDLPPLKWSADHDSQTLEEEMGDAAEKAYGGRDHREAA